MAEQTKEQLMAMRQEADLNKAGCVKEVEGIKVRIEEFVKAKQKEVDDFAAEQNKIRDTIITKAVEYQGQIQLLDKMIAKLDPVVEAEVVEPPK